jgi:sugar lactone lactonase YvrE
MLFLGVAAALIPAAHSAGELKPPLITPAPAGSPDPAADSVRRLALPATDLIVDPTTQSIYASVPGSAGPAGNSLARIDPVTGTIAASILIGSDPGKLAISDNNQFLYVALDGEAAVRRFDLATQTPQLRFPVGSDPNNGPLLAADIDVMPGAPETVAIARRFVNISPEQEGVAIYDNGVRRPLATTQHQTHISFLEFSASPATLYGKGFGGPSVKLSVTANGVTMDNPPATFPSGSGDLEFADGLVYYAGGAVVDPVANTTIGTYPGLDFCWSVVVDAANNRVYFLSGGGDFEGQTNRNATIHAFNKSTFALVASYQVPTIGRVRSLVQWGPTGLAFRDENFVYFVPTPGSGPAPESPSPTPTPTPSPTPGPGELREIALATNELIVEPAAQKIYASIPAGAGALGNTLTRIDPVTAAVGSSVPVGSEPNRLAISDNGARIFVALDGENAIQPFDVATQTAGPKFSIGNRVVDMAVMPGSVNTIAISRNQSAPEIVIYDNATPRPIIRQEDVSTIAFSNSPAVLYGYDAHTSAYEFSKMGVAACGVALSEATSSLINGSNFEIKYDNGRVYSGAGRVIDPETKTLLGTFFTPTGLSLVETDSATKRIYLLTSFFSSTTLRVYDMQTFVLLGTLTFPTATTAPRSLVRWGTDGLAFNTATQVFLLQSPLIAGSPAPVTPAPPASPATFTARGSVFEVNTPLSGVTMTYSGLGSGSVQTGADGRFAVPNLPLCGTLTVTPSKPNYVFTPPSFTYTNVATQGASFSGVHRTVGFSFSQITVSEGANRVFVPISISGAAFPNGTDMPYATSNGTASDRSDYTQAKVVVHYDGISGFGTPEILITNDVFVEGPETFTVTMDPVPGYELVNPTVTITIADNDTVPPVASPLLNPSFFVRLHYHDFLNREPDTNGLNFWTAQIDACNGEADLQKKGDCLEERHINVSAAFFFSIEFQATGYLVHRLYAASFPDSAARPKGLPKLFEFLRDTQQLQRGVVVNAGDWQQVLEQNTQDFIRRWVDRAEFRAQFPDGLTGGQYVAGLFANGGVAPTTAERAAALAAYGSGGTEGRALALRNVAGSGSIYNKQYNSAFVLMQYFGYLRRNPSDPPEATLDFAGYNFWLQKLNQFSNPGEDVRNEGVALERVRRADMLKSFLVSGEYMNRFGPDNFDIRH